MLINMKRKNIKKTQSVLEYICVSAAFAAAGIATFVALSSKALLAYRGSGTNTTPSTLAGKVITDPANRVTEQQKWQEPTANITSWNQPQSEIDNRVPTNLVADSETHESTWTQDAEGNYVDEEKWRDEIPEEGASAGS
ncbi:MAG: hypothetical protein PHV55_04575 [Candidatus Omnitrophica bacterium]|nr:hypothetical protein [Candidatus Omnitrophota bacterium]